MQLADVNKRTCADALVALGTGGGECVNGHRRRDKKEDLRKRSVSLGGGGDIGANRRSRRHDKKDLRRCTGDPVQANSHMQMDTVVDTIR